MTNKNYKFKDIVDSYSGHVIEMAREEAMRDAANRQKTLEEQKERTQKELQSKREEALEKTKEFQREAKERNRERVEAFNQRRKEMLDEADQILKDHRSGKSKNEFLGKSYEGSSSGSSASEDKDNKPGIMGWNPHSKWSGTGRILQAIPVVRRNVEKFVSNNSRYSNMEQMEERTYAALKEMPELRKSGDILQQLERHKLIASGYQKELELVDAVESGERKTSPEYVKAKALLNNVLKRVSNNNLKNNREFSLKALVDKGNERMYSSLSLFYHYCEK